MSFQQVSPISHLNKIFNKILNISIESKSYSKRFSKRLLNSIIQSNWARGSPVAPSLPRAAHTALTLLPHSDYGPHPSPPPPPPPPAQTVIKRSPLLCMRRAASVPPSLSNSTPVSSFLPSCTECARQFPRPSARCGRSHGQVL